MPCNERFTILIKLQQVLHENIEAVNRKKLIDGTPLAPDAAQGFFQVGTPAVTIQQPQQQQQPVVQPPPPMLQQQPQAIQQQQVYQNTVAMSQLQLGSNMYRDREITYEDM